jgi:hypothetical protein
MPAPRSSHTVPTEPFIPALGSSLWLARAQAPAETQFFFALGPRVRGDERD